MTKEQRDNIESMPVLGLLLDKIFFITEEIERLKKQLTVIEKIKESINGSESCLHID